MLLPNKVPFVSAFVFVVVVVSAASRHGALLASAYPSSSISPNRIHYDVLANADDGDRYHTTTPLLDALRKGNGIVSITDLPNDFRDVKLRLMSHLHDCITSIDDASGGSGGVGIPAEYYRDGTLRKSFVTSTRPNGGARSIEVLEEFVNGRSSSSSSSSCARFRDRLPSFRSTVDGVTRQFATKLSDEMEGSTLLGTTSRPLLRNSDPAGEDYVNIDQIVNGGVHLEHFHSYQKNTKVVGGAEYDSNGNDDIEDDGYEDGDEEKEKTIEFHTDQGFFIVFTPGMIVSRTATHTGSAARQQEGLPLSNGFYIQDTTNGERMHLVFTDEDELVFMMGDGVNQL